MYKWKICNTYDEELLNNQKLINYTHLEVYHNLKLDSEVTLLAYYLEILCLINILVC